MKTTPIGSEATGGMSAKLHEFLLAQSVPIDLLGRTKQKQMGQHENMKAIQLQNSAAFSVTPLKKNLKRFFLFPFYAPNRNCKQVLANQVLVGVGGLLCFCSHILLCLYS